MESKDYELAASLKRKIDSAESVSPVAEEVWKSPRRKKLPSLPSWRMAATQDGGPLPLSTLFVFQQNDGQERTLQRLCQNTRGAWMRWDGDELNSIPHRRKSDYECLSILLLLTKS